MQPKINQDNFINILEIAFKVASIIGILVLFWYTFETHKIRVHSEQQLRTIARPLLDFGSDKLSNIWVTNQSNNPALNARFFIKIDGTWYLHKFYFASAIAPKDKINIFLLKNGVYDREDKNLMQLDQDYIYKFPEVGRITNYLELKKNVTSGAFSIYEDLFGNKIYTISSDDPNKPFESGYVLDL